MRIISNSRLINQSLIFAKRVSFRDSFVLQYYCNTIFLLHARLAFREEEALGLSETILLWEVFVKTIVDGCNNLLKYVLFLFYKRSLHIVLSFIIGKYLSYLRTLDHVIMKKIKCLKVHTDELTLYD